MMSLPLLTVHWQVIRQVMEKAEERSKRWTKPAAYTWLERAAADLIRTKPELVAENARIPELLTLAPPPADEQHQVIGLTILHGLHHDYRWLPDWVPTPSDSLSIPLYDRSIAQAMETRDCVTPKPMEFVL
jgi:hypothetical protein